jgi:UDPglucose 6-dehydrogenase
MLAQFYQSVIGDDVRVARMNIVNAELTKISVNTFVTTKISYANMLAEVCERIPGCDVDVVTAAIGLDTRIGRKYLSGGLGYGGPCFPRDNVAFATIARRYGATPTLAEATDSVNRRQALRIAERIKAVLPPERYVGILGLSYKPNTNVIEESQGVMIAQTLGRQGIPVNVYDPVSMPNAQQVLGDAVIYASALAECLQNSHVIAITTPWEEFKSIQPEQIAHNPRRVILDCWRILSPDRIAPVADYLTIGKI